MRGITRHSPDDATRPEAGSALDAAIRLVRHHLFEVQNGRDELSRALKRSDATQDELEHMAKSLASAWSSAKGAVKALEGRVVEAHREEYFAKHALRTHGHTVHDVFRRAVVQADGTALHERLLRLNVELGALGDVGAGYLESGLTALEVADERG